MSLRTSPGSPSQRMATLSLRAPRAWRSTQLWERLSLPLTNHLAWAASPSMTLVQGVNQSSSFAASAQNSSGCSTLRRYMSSYWARLLIWAFAANSAGGGKSRFSRRVESRFALLSAVDTHQPPRLSSSSRRYPIQTAVGNLSEADKNNDTQRVRIMYGVSRI